MPRPHPLALALSLALAAAPAVRADDDAKPANAASTSTTTNPDLPAPTPAKGLGKAVTENPKVEPKAADGDSPLAEGWPDATRPGMIAVKPYPAYRSAVARASKAGQPADNVLFWPLFNHISRKGIEMTTPVVNTYTPDMVKDPKTTGDMSMEFVYRTTTMGETGAGVGAVKVEDHPAALYVCLGIQGRMSAERMRDAVSELETWLDEHKADWVAAGPPRRLGYHGPMTPTERRLWEVQIPIKPAKGEAK